MKTTQMNSEKYKNKYRIASARADWWDYSSNAAYFITICTKNRELFFGNIYKGKMQLSSLGQFAHDYWMEIPQHFPFIKLGAFVVMPNHVHGIIIIDAPDINPVETLHATSLQSKTALQNPPSQKNEFMSSISPKKGSLASVVRSYKSAVTKSARKINAKFGWQARYHDHIIRNEAAYFRISNYIINNPLKWEEDRFYEPG